MKLKLLSIVLMAFILTACGTAGPTTPTPLPTVMLDGGSSPSPQAQTTKTAKVSGVAASGVTASGVVIPAQEAQLAFAQGGKVKTVNVAVGDQVKAGQTLVELDNASALMDFNQADRNLKEMTSQASIAAAEQDLANAQQTQKDAQKKTDSMFFPRATDVLIKNTEGEIALAKVQVARSADTYRQLSRLPDGDNRKATALVAMTNAQLNLNRLIAQLNWYTGKPTEIDAALAQANLDAAKAAVQESKWYLSFLKGEQIPADATGSKLAQLQQARDGLAAARERLDATHLIAPISGMVAAVNGDVGEIASPGVVVIVVSNVSRLRVETTDLSERDVPSVKVGQTVTVTITALSQDVTGRVALISPVSTTLGGDVVYKTTIDLDSLPEGLRAGMSVDVLFETE